MSVFPLRLVPMSISHPAMAGSFGVIARTLPDRLWAVAYTHGTGFWNEIFTHDVGLRVNYCSDVGIETRDYAQDLERDECQSRIAIAAARINAALSNHLDISTNFCRAALIVRRHSMILLNARQHQTEERFFNLYIPSPIAAGHDLVEDLPDLERRLPGRFVLASDGARA